MRTVALARRTDLSSRLIHCRSPQEESQATVEMPCWEATNHSVQERTMGHGHTLRGLGVGRTGDE